MTQASSAAHVGSSATMLNVKPRPNHAVYLRVLRRMTPEERLHKAFDLAAAARARFEHGLRRRFPDSSDEDFSRLLRRRLDQCHNRNY